MKEACFSTLHYNILKSETTEKFYRLLDLNLAVCLNI